MTCPRTTALGAYVLGALEREERAGLEAHLETCDVCREELDRLAPLPGLLSRLTLDEAEVLETAEPESSAASLAGAPRPEPAAGVDPLTERLPEESSAEPLARGPRPEPAHSTAPLERALFEVGRERRRSRLMRAVAVAAAALVLAAAVVTGGQLLGGGDGGGGPAPLTAAASDLRTGVHGAAELTPEPWGTRVELRLAGVRPGQHCRLVARSAGGRSEVAATWRAGYLGTAEVPGAVAIPAERLTSLDVVTPGDRVLVRMPVTRR
jgi:putative zinc finger protein